MTYEGRHTFYTTYTSHKVMQHIPMLLSYALLFDKPSVYVDDRGIYRSVDNNVTEILYQEVSEEIEEAYAKGYGADDVEVVSFERYDPSTELVNCVDVFMDIDPTEVDAKDIYIEFLGVNEYTKEG